MVKAKLVRQLSYLWVLDTNDLKTSVANQPGYFKECVFTLSWLKKTMQALVHVKFQGGVSPFVYSKKAS